MAKRSKNLSDKLGQKTPGWQQQIQPEAPAEERPTYKRKTYLITPEMIERIEAAANRQGVGINELVRYLLGDSLERLEEGELQLPIEVEEVRRIKGE